MTKLIQTINWQPFSNKHKYYIRDAMRCRMSVAEGSIRSGKTIDNCIIAAMYLETCKDKIHLASGSTIANAKLNIGACNGFGLENLFKGRCKWGKYKGNECLYIYTQTGEKVLIFAGGGKADSYKKILGNSYGLWIATEINEHYDSEDSRESFIKVAFGRQVASAQPKVLWDLNPCNPKHPIYSDYIDKYLDEFVGGYNYKHFTLKDNLSISPQRMKEIESQYDKNSIWYRRDILGQRCVAEGIVYPQFADNPERYSCDIDIDKNIRFAIINIGVDFGGNGSATAFVCTGITQGFEKVIPIFAERHAEELNPEELNECFVDFCEMCYHRFCKSMECYADSAEQILIRGIRLAVARSHVPIIVRNARKNPINDRIKLVNKLVAQDRFLVNKDAETVTDAMCEALWDIKHPDQRLDNGTTDIDTLDALEYSIERHINDFIRVR